MDPITAFGLLSSLSSLIEASSSLLKILRTFKDGDRELLDLFNDVSVFQEALKGFNRVLRRRQTKHQISTTVISKALEEASRTLQALERKLIQMSKYEVLVIRRMKWVQHKSSLIKLHERVKEQSIMLQSFLSLAHTYVAFHSNENHATNKIRRETFLNACNEYPHFLQIRSLSAEDITSDADSTSSETSMIMSDDLSNSQRRASVDTAPSSIGSSDSQLEKTSYNTSNRPRGSEVEDSSASAVILRKGCRYDCYCQCHAQGVTPNKGFSRVAGFHTQCSDRSCQASKPPDEPAVTPSKFFRKALAQVVSSKSIRVRYDLSTFRMVSEGSDAMRYVKHGNLDKLKACIETGNATLWDTALDGWSLLHVS